MVCSHSKGTQILLCLKSWPSRWCAVIARQDNTWVPLLDHPSGHAHPVAMILHGRPCRLRAFGCRTHFQFPASPQAARRAAHVPVQGTAGPPAYRAYRAAQPVPAMRLCWVWTWQQQQQQQREQHVLGAACLAAAAWTLVVMRGRKVREDRTARDICVLQALAAASGAGCWFKYPHRCSLCM